MREERKMIVKLTLLFVFFAVMIRVGVKSRKNANSIE